MNKIITYVDSYTMPGAIPKKGIIKETVFKLDQTKKKVSGIDILIRKFDGTSITLEEHGVKLSIRDKYDILFDKIWADKLAHNQNIPSDERFYPMNIDTDSNELRFTYEDQNWIEDGTKYIDIMLRYE